MTIVIQYGQTFTEQYKERLQWIVRGKWKVLMFSIKKVSHHTNGTLVWKRFFSDSNQSWEVWRWYRIWKRGKILVMVTYLDNEILINSTQDTIMYLLDSVEASFGIPGKVTCDATVFWQFGNKFLMSMQTFLDEIADDECD